MLWIRRQQATHSCSRLLTSRQACSPSAWCSVPRKRTSASRESTAPTSNPSLLSEQSLSFQVLSQGQSALSQPLLCTCPCFLRTCPTHAPASQCSLILPSTSACLKSHHFSKVCEATSLGSASHQRGFCCRGQTNRVKISDATGSPGSPGHLGLAWQLCPEFLQNQALTSYRLCLPQ